MRIRPHALFLVLLTASGCDTSAAGDESTPAPERPRKRQAKRPSPAKSHVLPEPSAPPSLAPSTAPALPAAGMPGMLHPALWGPALANKRAPATFRARFDTTKGPVTFDCDRSWAPHGVDRFYNLVAIGFFVDVALYRVAPGFVVQWGIHGDPKVSAAWKSANLPVDPVTHSNVRGTLTFAMAASPTTRSTQLFINYGDNSRLDAMGFAPICEVSAGMSVADTFDATYKERITSQQASIMSGGNAYLRKTWPGLDYIVSASIVSEGVVPRPRAPRPQDPGF